MSDSSPERPARPTGAPLSSRRPEPEPGRLDGLTLTVVGCSGSASGPSSPASCYLVQAPHDGGVFTLVLDLGPGSFGALCRHVDPAEVDAIGFSHLHADHCLDFCSFHVAAHYSPRAPFDVELYGPAGTSQRLARAYEVDPADVDAFATRWPVRVWQPVQQVGPLTVRTAPVRHPVEAYAVRVELGGTSLTFTGDTGPCEELVELARGSDLLLAECGHPEWAETGGVHLRPSEVADLARRADVAEVLLTHISPWFDAEGTRAEVETAGPVPVRLAASGLTVPVRRSPPAEPAEGDSDGR